MKKHLVITLCALFALASCTPKEHTDRQAASTHHPDYAYNAVIYELNTRQFTPEGTFAAAERELPRLDSLGVSIIWVMPVQPIGVLNRKGTLGSYYAISDYCAFNPEFGTRADFESFLAKAHSLGMKVILDWVANHTAPDHPWVNNDGWHLRNSLGNLVVKYDWTDIAELNYDNQDMRHAMFDAISWWVDTIGVDGFRCDVAHEVPTDFWEATFDSLRLTHPDLFTLCESETPELTDSAFDMYYGWELHNIMNGIAQGKNTPADLWAYFEKADTVFQPYAIRMNFTSNHDENSWNGSEFERMGAAVQAMNALTYVLPGMPLIYTGQEYGLKKRLAFFEKDTVPTDSIPILAIAYRSFNDFRKSTPAVFSPEKGAPLVRLDFENPAIFAFTRTLDDSGVVAIFNLSAEPQTISYDLASFKETEKSVLAGNVGVNTLDSIIEFMPWGYYIFSFDAEKSTSSETQK